MFEITSKKLAHEIQINNLIIDTSLLDYYLSLKEYIAHYASIIMIHSNIVQMKSLACSHFDRPVSTIAQSKTNQF